MKFYSGPAFGLIGGMNGVELRCWLCVGFCAEIVSRIAVVFVNIEMCKNEYSARRFNGAINKKQAQP